MVYLRTLLLVFFFLGSCSGAAQEEKSTSLPVPESHPVEDVVQKKLPLQAIIPKAEFDKVIQEGPQKFISKLLLKPYFQNNRFIGFQLAKVFWKTDEMTEHIIRPGDVIVKVNGLKIEKPEEFMNAWEAVTGSTVLEFTILRDGQLKKITYDIQ
jgi:type II secretory pathway component PulC